MLVSMFRKYRTVWLSKGYGFLEINYFKIVLFFFFKESLPCSTNQTQFYFVVISSPELLIILSPHPGAAGI